MAEDSRKFWNPFSETLPRKDIQAIQLQHLRKLVEYSQANSILYKDRLGFINPASVRENAYQIQLLRIPVCIRSAVQ